jgi:hypothetical protein
VLKGKKTRCVKYFNKEKTYKMTINEAIIKLETFINDNSEVPFNLVLPTLQEYLKLLSAQTEISIEELFIQWMNYKNRAIKNNKIDF